MFDAKIYFELLDWLDGAGEIRPAEFLRRLQNSYDLAGCLYVDAAVSISGAVIHQLHHSFDQDVYRAVSEMGGPGLSHIFSRCSRALEPIDLQELSRQNRHTIEFKQRIYQVNNRLRAVCYPLLSRDSRNAFFVIARSCDTEEWRLARRCYDRDIYRLAGKFHARQIDRQHTEPLHDEQASLTQREKEALLWTAAGKSYWETSIILGISERTVRYFMANARNKLDAVSNTQAVAKAMSQGLIPPAPQ
ncbi:helix-turn-helix transcriptional regulator [Rhizobium paknamense]|uniref:LuxR family quorum-sensing system transcriptional regulator SinR n=1 Tax=Rhizobium paknamense TaxID=1206817 RepID=A0ABU0ICH8_9HYPH|nr:helix-turn-helix transcriptional regulator [Rhizobium paknamense]MDQ0455944.1 LuxR family quorum-sensing system transcriptional regulator SinR [Rhizobium paknamense]